MSDNLSLVEQRARAEAEEIAALLRRHGEKLPAPEQRSNSGLLSGIDPLNPFALVAVFVIGAVLRSALGRLIGSVATAGVVGVLAWMFFGSLAISVIAAAVAFFFTMLGESIASLNGGHGNWSSGGGFSGSSSGGGGFSGGGGSFGGGGASGSW